MSILNQYTDDEFRNIVKNSYSIREVTKKLGYNANSGDLYNYIRKRICDLNIDITHFSKYGRGRIERIAENVFIENSTVSQKVLRSHYKKGNYTSYVCSICGQEPIWQGKDLTLILDHINGCNHDDRLENLRWVCPNCNQQLDTTGSRNKNWNNWNIQTVIKKKYYCFDCGKEITKGAIRCSSCASKLSNQQNKKFYITREELKTLIRELPFTKVAKQFGVSDNAIRKRCKSFNLPYKSSEIKNYSDEEWELL